MTGRTQDRPNDGASAARGRRGIVLGAALLALTQWACDDGDWVTGPSRTRMGSGHPVTETRAVSGFDALTVEGALQVTVSLDGTEGLEVTAEDNIISAVRTHVQGHTLQLGIEPGIPISTNYGVRVRLRARHLPRIESSGASHIEVSGVSEEELDVVLSGASRLQIDGSVDRFRGWISGASSMEGADLSCRSAEASLSGASYGVLRVSELLEAEVSGVSTLEYFGDPMVHAHTSGGGSVSRVGP
jgi:Putative auto-transporter adhesin, head GIN domain